MPMKSPWWKALYEDERPKVIKDSTLICEYKVTPSVAFSVYMMPTKAIERQVFFVVGYNPSDPANTKELDETWDEPPTLTQILEWLMNWDSH